jgi:hypothetical protein
MRNTIKFNCTIVHKGSEGLMLNASVLKGGFGALEQPDGKALDEIRSAPLFCGLPPGLLTLLAVVCPTL